MYEYQCTLCQQRIEKIQSFSAEPLRVCESCGGPLEKLISAPAIQFKGTGWYVTDYAKKSSVAASASSGESKSDAKSAGNDAKAEAKSDTASASSGSEPSSSAAPAAKPADRK